jgi:soluble lytic murein transglycosylase-like protein
MKRLVAITAAVAALALGRAAFAAEVPAPLSAADIKLYSQAFEAAEKGDFETVESQLAKVKDDSLAGRFGYARLMHPRHTATYAELTAWLKAYGGEAGADRIHALALRRKPDGVAAPKAPAFVAAVAAAEKADDNQSARAAAGRKGVDRAQAAREAYYSGDVRRALTLASASGERWIAGLAAFRLERPADAFGFFRAVADDASEDAWLRSAAAFWAARSGVVAGAPEAATYLQLAAQTPHTFYGMIAERQLALREGAIKVGLQPALNLGADPIADLIGQAAYAAPLALPPTRATAEPVVALPTDARAHRAEALFQLGHKTEALAEAKIGLALAKTDKARDAWQELADSFAPPPAAKPVKFTPPPVTPRVIPAMTVRQTYTVPALPAPELAPKGGFTIDKAMVYALVRQESAFNPLAQSGAGAVGLMQLMPEAAARAAGDDKLKTDMTPLFDPAFNLRVGQDYFTWLMERGMAADPGGYDVLRAVAAYNGGAGALLKTVAQLGQDCDSLLLIESLPAQETRNYVERVVAAYWQYRRMFGGETPTLDALATGEKLADFRLDGGITASSLTYSLTGG